MRKAGCGMAGMGCGGAQGRGVQGSAQLLTSSSQVGRQDAAQRTAWIAPTTNIQAARPECWSEDERTWG